MGNQATGLTTLLVGIDAACRDVLDPLFGAGALPTLERLFGEGASGELESQLPPWTSSAWPSLYTGMNPGKHGVFDFLHFDGYDWEVANATHLRERPLWEALDLFDRASVVVNVPLTHPPRPFDGALIPGYMAPEDPACHPEGLLDDVRDAVGDYRVYPSASTGAPERYVELIRMRGRAFRYLAERFDPDFGFLQFQQTDTVFHERPDDRETVRAIYEAVDEEVAATLDACDPATVLVASDHGIGPYGGYEFRVNEFLREHGYVKTARGGAGMPTWATVRDERFVRGDADTRPRRSRLQGVGTALARAGLTSQRAGRLLGAVGLDGAALRIVPQHLVRAATERVDFERSTAYMRSRIELGVRVNLAGRDPGGTVAPEDYEAVRAELVDLLSAVRTPDGLPVFEEVALRERYFDGPAADEAVDVVTVPREFDEFLSAQLSGAVFGEPAEPWNHKRDGVIAATGDAVDPTVPLGDAHLFDVAPTVLATMGLPADERMDGRALPVVAAAGERRYPPFEGRTTRSTDDREVERRLANLGYLER